MKATSPSIAMYSYRELFAVYFFMSVFLPSLLWIKMEGNTNIFCNARSAVSCYGPATSSSGNAQTLKDMNGNSSSQAVFALTTSPIDRPSFDVTS